MILFEKDLDCGIPDSMFEQALHFCLDEHSITTQVSVGLRLTDNSTIREINNEYRNLNRSTDVLSFPNLSLSPGCLFTGVDKQISQAWDSDTGTCFLGDIIISLPAAKYQASEYGHSFFREILYLFIHGLLHLFGYDHIDKNDQRCMRLMEEKVYRIMNKKNTKPEELLKLARKARENAYVPYSHYKVGAALLCEDGSVYTGCNIENSSFGLTICAERTAIFKAVSEGKKAFSAIAIAADATAPWPCGACRQVMTEFAPDIPVYITWADGQQDHASLQELLPHSFQTFEEDRHD